MNERDQILSFLLAQCDGYRKTVEGLQKQVAELQKAKAADLAESK